MFIGLVGLAAIILAAQGGPAAALPLGIFWVCFMVAFIVAAWER